MLARERSWVLSLHLEAQKVEMEVWSLDFGSFLMSSWCQNPLVLIFDKKISSVQAILPLLEQVAKVQKPLLLIAEDVDGEAE